MRRVYVNQIIGVAIAVSACSDPTISPPLSDSTEISQFSRRPADDGRAFWRGREDSLLWADLGPRRLALVGLRRPGTDRGVVNGRVVIDSADQVHGERAVLNVRGVEYVSRDRTLPIIRVKVTDIDALIALRRLPHADYVEPDLFKAPPGGLLQDVCGGGDYGDPLEYIAEGDGHGPNFFPQGVVGAWQRGAAGQGVTIGLIDSGIDPAQAQFQSEFTDGLSAGRSISITSTRGDGPNDTCGHGTHMAGILVAPRDGRNVLGVAWRANFIAVRAVSSPLLLEGSVADVNAAIDVVAPVASIIVMGFGSPFVFNAMSDKIAEWYNQGRMFFAPMGNSAPWHYALFPASLPNVVAVTGTSETCKWCRRAGTALDFEALTSNPTTGAVSLSGSASIERSSQSSGATALTAGIAALVWSMHNNWTREDVLLRMKQCSVYKVWTPERGYGFVDANCAVQEPPPSALSVYIERNNIGGGDPDMIYAPSDPSETSYVDFFNTVDVASLPAVRFQWHMMWDDGDWQLYSNEPSISLGFMCTMAGHSVSLKLTVFAPDWIAGRSERSWYITGSGCS